MIETSLHTLPIWAMGDTALLPALLDGLDDFVPQMTMRRVDGATHWIVHEQPALVATFLQEFLRQAPSQFNTEKARQQAGS